MSNTERGLFISFEGGEGAGKTTQIKLLAQYLKEVGLKVVTTREPGGEALAEKIRELLLHESKLGDVTDEGEALLFNAARAQLVKRVIRPRLEEGYIVLSDRFVDSTIAYQGYGRGLDIWNLRGVCNFATGGLLPDITLLLDIPANIGLARQRYLNRIEEENGEFHIRVRNGFLKLVEDEPDRFLVLDACLPISELCQKIVEELHRRFGFRLSAPCTKSKI